MTYETVGRLEGQADMGSMVSADMQNFSVSEGRLQSLAGVTVPDSLNPLLHYVMLGRVELMLYIDFNNDEFYLRPCSCAEAFMNLFVPERKVTEVEVTQEYAIFRIVDYVIVGYDFRDRPGILKGIMAWLMCEEGDILNDEYGLYYYVQNFGLYEWYCSRFRDIIESHFMCVRLSPVTAVALDDVGRARGSQDTLLDFTVTGCRWRAEKGLSAKCFNIVDWRHGGVGEHRPAERGEGHRGGVGCAEGVQEALPERDWG